MDPQNPKGSHKYAPPAPSMAVPPSSPPVFPENATPPFPYPYPQGKCLSPEESPECTGKGDGGAPMEYPEMGTKPFPNKNVRVPLSSGKGTGAYEWVNGFPAAPPCPSTSSVVYLQRIGTGASEGDYEIACSTSFLDV